MATFDLHILPIYRVNGQEAPELPGLMALTPPRRAARGREHDTLIVYLMVSGNATLSAFELHDLIKNTAAQFHQTSGSLTAAMRRAAENINTALLERNLATSGRGLQALGTLMLAVIRNEQCTLLLSGPAHAIWVSEGRSRHIHDPALSGKGLGSGQSIQSYFSQVELHAQDLLALCGKFPQDWEADLLNERPPASLEASYRKLTMTPGDLHAALIQVHSGHGTILILRPEIGTVRSHRSHPAPPPVVEGVPAPQADALQPEPVVEPSSVPEEQVDALADFAAHLVQPSAYAIPPQPENPLTPLRPEPAPPPPASRSFPASIPRRRPAEPVLIPVDAEEGAEEQGPVEEPIVVESRAVRRARSNAHAEATRQMARFLVGGLKLWRRMTDRLGASLQGFLPRLLPGTDPSQANSVPTYLMAFIAVVIPILVVTIASVVYLRFGQSVQYTELYQQAFSYRAQATSETDPVLQRIAWENVLSTLEKAHAYRETEESRALRADAQANYDKLMGVMRLEFIPAFPNALGSSAQISRLAASESELYMLDAEDGSIRHASFTGRSLSLDNTFRCEPGTYAGYQVGMLIDILALPKVNAVGASVLGIDASGNLLYCAPGQVPQAIPLPPLPNTRWGRITAFALDNGNLYVLDAASRAVWVFVGKDSSFIDSPYFYFGNQIPNIENAIDMAVSGDDLYMLHADGHLTSCTFSRITETPTRCQDPAPRLDHYPAHRDLDVFAQAHFTQMTLTNPPNPVVLLLDSENQMVYRLSPRSLELQNQVTGFAGKDSPFQAGPVTAMAVSPNYVLYLAIGNQVYFATNLP